MYHSIKKYHRTIKYGIRHGKGLAAGYAVTAHKELSNNAQYFGQGIGLLLLPFIYFLFQPLTKRLTLATREKLTVLFYAGIAVGNSLGTILSNQLLSALPSSLDNLIGATIGILGVSLIATTVSLLAARFDYKNKGTKSAKHYQAMRHRFLLGLQSGLLLGSSLGASIEFIYPGLGVLTSAACSVVGTAVGLTLAMAAPALLKKLNLAATATGKKAISYAPITKSMKNGAYLGSAVGIILGTFVFPGFGSVLGGVLFSGIFGVLAGASSWGFTHYAGSEIKSSKLYTFLTDRQTISSLGFSMKVSVTGMSLVGAVVGTFMFPAVGTMLGAAVGGLVGSIFGFLPVAVTLSKTKRQDTVKEEVEVARVPLWKKMKLGFSLGSPIGGLVGAAIGSTIPVVGTILGGLAGSFLGGLIGITVSAVCSPESKKIMPTAAINQPEQKAPVAAASGQPKEIVSALVSYEAINSVMDRASEKPATVLSQEKESFVNFVDKRLTFADEPEPDSTLETASAPKAKPNSTSKFFSQNPASCRILSDYQPSGQSYTAAIRS